MCQLIYGALARILDFFLLPISRFLYLIKYGILCCFSDKNWYVGIRSIPYHPDSTKGIRSYQVRLVINTFYPKEPRILFSSTNDSKQYTQALEWFYSYLDQEWGDSYVGLYCTKDGGSLFYARLKKLRTGIIQEHLSLCEIIVLMIGSWWWFANTWFIRIDQYIDGITILQCTITVGCYLIGVMVLLGAIKYHQKIRCQNYFIKKVLNLTRKNISEDNEWYYSIY